MKLNRVSCALNTVLFTSALAWADDAESFQKSCARSFEILQNAYSNVIIEGICSYYDLNGKFDFKQNTTIYRLGEKTMWIATRKENANAETEKEYPVGSLMVRGGSKDLFFSATKRPKTEDFVFSEFGPIDPDYYQKTTRLRCFAAFAPFSVIDIPILELLSSKDFSFQESSLKKSPNGDTILASFNVRVPKAKSTSINLVLQAKTFAVLEYTVIGPNNLLRGQVTYENPAVYPPIVKSVDTWVEGIGNTTKLTRKTFDVTSLKFAKPSEDKFTPAGVGMVEVPVIPQK